MIPFPKALADTAAQLAAILGNSPIANLRPMDRLALYDAIDLYAGPYAYQMKAWLGILTAQRVCGYWRMTMSDPPQERAFWETAPQQIIQTASDYLAGVISRDVAWELLRSCQEVDTFSGDGVDSPYYRGWSVFKAATDALWQVFNADSWQSLLRHYQLTTDDDPYQGDTAQWAAIAYGGGIWTPAEPDKWRYDEEGMIWLPDDICQLIDDDQGTWDYFVGDVQQRRRQFWEWWLTDALQAAWARSQGMLSA